MLDYEIKEENRFCFKVKKRNLSPESYLQGCIFIYG